MFKGFTLSKKKSQHVSYDEKYTPTRHVKLYEQKKSVKNIQNLPRGKYSVRNKRPEGYVDYQPGMYYISAFVLATESPEDTATLSIDRASIKAQEQEDKLQRY